MQIGNFDQQNHADGLATLIETNAPGHMTKAQKQKNWWHYHKWYVIAGTVLLAALIHLIGSSLGLFTKSPDLQIAYVGSARLPEDTVAALERLFSSLMEDANQDGEILVQVNQYLRNDGAADAETAYYQYASEISLLGDISDCESYLFLMDEPDTFQREFQILAAPDGNCPNAADYSAEGKIIPWSDCPLLSDAETGSFTDIVGGQTVTGNNQELLTGLSLGRRCFYTGKTTDNKDACEALWNLLYHSCKDK